MKAKRSCPEKDAVYEALMFPPERRMLYPNEIAQKLRCHIRHIRNLIDEGRLRAINISGDTPKARRQLRIPIEAWEQYVRNNML